MLLMCVWHVWLFTRSIQMKSMINVFHKIIFTIQQFFQQQLIQWLHYIQLSCLFVDDWKFCLWFFLFNTILYRRRVKRLHKPDLVFIFGFIVCVFHIGNNGCHTTILNVCHHLFDVDCQSIIIIIIIIILSIFDLEFNM